MVVLVAVAAVVSLILLSVLLFAVVSFVSIYRSRSLGVLKLLPGPRPSLLFGNALQMPVEAYGAMQQCLAWMAEYNRDGIMCLWLGPMYPLVLIYKPELAETLLSSSKHTTKSPEYDFLHPWLGTGLLTSDGEKWKKRRRLITPAFHFTILNDFIQVCEEQAAIFVSHLEKKIDNDAFDIMPYTALLTLDIICVTSMGVSPNAQGESSSPYVKAIVRVSELLELRGRSPWLWSDTIYKLSPSGKDFYKCLSILHDFTEKVIDTRITERAARNVAKEEVKYDEGNAFRRKKRLAFIDVLLEAYENGEISREGVREEVDTFMFEGHDTTASAITWTLYLLGRHPDIQQRVYEEVDAFFERRPDTLTAEDLREFRYTESVIKEAQRLFPSVPFFARRATEDCELAGYSIPKGTAIGVSTMRLHRNPDVWEAPLEFDPSRFHSENNKGRHPFAFIPFSAGPRNCIGQRLALLEEKLVLAHVLRHFRIHATQPFEEVKTCTELVLRPNDGIFVTLEKRT